MDFFKRNPNALPITLGILLFIALFVYSGIRQGTWSGEDKAPATAAAVKGG